MQPECKIFTFLCHRSCSVSSKGQDMLAGGGQGISIMETNILQHVQATPITVGRLAGSWGINAE